MLGVRIVNETSQKLTGTDGQTGGQTGRQTYVLGGCASKNMLEHSALSIMVNPLIINLYIK